MAENMSGGIPEASDEKSREAADKKKFADKKRELPEKGKKRRNDFILIVVLLLIAAVFTIGLRVFSGGGAGFLGKAGEDKEPNGAELPGREKADKNSEDAGKRAVISLSGEDILEIELSGEYDITPLKGDAPEDKERYSDGVSEDEKAAGKENSDFYVDIIEKSEGGVKFKVETKAGYNIFSAENGSIRCEESDCPDKVCVEEGLISLNTETIVCLPHKVIVRVL